MAVARREEDVAWQEAEVHHDPQNGKSASASLAPPTNQLHPPTFLRIRPPATNVLHPKLDSKKWVHIQVLIKVQTCSLILLCVYSASIVTRFYTRHVCKRFASCNSTHYSTFTCIILLPFAD